MNNIDSNLIELFGGAITSILPNSLFDASTLRQIPDTQEVYISKDSDTSLILEVLELVTEEGSANDPLAAIQFHWKSLLQDVSALSSQIDSITPASTSSTTTTSPLLQGPTILSGLQTISKFNLPSSEADQVKIYMALWRIPTKNSDLVLTFNCPLGKVGCEITEEERELERRSGEIFKRAVENLVVRDFGLLV